MVGFCLLFLSILRGVKKHKKTMNIVWGKKHDRWTIDEQNHTQRKESADYYESHLHRKKPMVVIGFNILIVCLPMKIIRGVKNGSIIAINMSFFKTYITRICAWWIIGRVIKCFIMMVINDYKLVEFLIRINIVEIRFFSHLSRSTTDEWILKITLDVKKNILVFVYSLSLISIV